MTAVFSPVDLFLWGKLHSFTPRTQTSAKKKMQSFDVSVEKRMELQLKREQGKENNSSALSSSSVPSSASSSSCVSSKKTTQYLPLPVSSTAALPRIPGFVGPVRMCVFLSECFHLSPEILASLPAPSAAALFVYVQEEELLITTSSSPAETGSCGHSIPAAAPHQPGKRYPKLVPDELVLECGRPQSCLATNFLRNSNYFCCLFAALSRSCIQFLTSTCAVVAQFREDCGGVHLFGQSLVQAVAAHNVQVGLPRDAVRKAGNSCFTHRGVRPWVSSSSSSRNQQLSIKKHRVELSAQQQQVILLSPKLLVSHGGANSKYTVFSAFASSAAVVSLSPQEQQQQQQQSAVSSSSPSALLSWVSPRAADIFKAMLQRQLGATHPLLVEATASVFSHIVNRHPTVESLQSGKVETTLALIDDSTTGLLQLMSAVVHVASRVNVRGSAIHVAVLSRNMARQQQQERQNASIGRDAAARPLSPSLVSIFFETLLRELSRRVCRLLTTEDHGSENRQEAETWLFGGSENLSRLLGSFRNWITCSWRSKGVKPTCFVNGVQLGNIAWLTRIEQGNRHRSARLQLTFCTFWSFLLAFVFPEWSRRSLHVTYAPKQSSLLVFYVRDEWNAWLRCALQPSVASLGAGRRSQQTNSDDPRRVEGDDVPDNDNNNNIHRFLPQRPITLVPQQQQQQRIANSFTGVSIVAALFPVLNSRLIHSMPSHRGFSNSNNGQSPNLAMYSAVRLLPDGRKLRPISIMRVASVQALRRMAARVPIGVHQQRTGRTVAVTQALHGSSNNNNTHNSSGVVVASNNHGHTSLRSGANKILLHRALLCLRCGLREHRVLNLEPVVVDPMRYYYCGKDDSEIATESIKQVTVDSFFVSGTPLKEYGELLDFARRVQQEAAKMAGNNSSEQSPLYFVKADATRCFDMLDQSLIEQLCRSLITHARYHSFNLAAVCPMTAKSVFRLTRQHDMGGEQSFSSSASSSFSSHYQLLLGCRRWQAVLTDAEFAAGCVPNVPAGWIIEPSSSRGSSSCSSLNSNYGSTAGTGSFLNCASSSSSGAAIALAADIPEVIDGGRAVSVLLHHTQGHLRVVRGRLYEQHGTGIAQGSAVAALLCDAILTAVDKDISELLAEFGQRGDAEEAAAASAADIKQECSLCLRRIDDLLVLTTSSHAAQAVEKRVIQGWPESVGFVCNPNKLQTSTSSSSPSLSVVPWCGLLLHCRTSSSSSSSRPFECSVDWARIQSCASLAAACLTQPSGGEHGLLLGFFRALRSIRMRFGSPALICTTINSPQRVYSNLHDTFCVLAGTLCEMIGLLVDGAGSNRSIGAARPHPRIFFRARVVAESSLRHHIQWQLGLNAAAMGSSAPEDAATVCRMASLKAFSRTLVVYARSTLRGRARMANAARIAAAVFSKMAGRIPNCNFASG